MDQPPFADIVLVTAGREAFDRLDLPPRELPDVGTAIPYVTALDALKTGLMQAGYSEAGVLEMDGFEFSAWMRNTQESE